MIAIVISTLRFGIRRVKHLYDRPRMCQYTRGHSFGCTIEWRSWELDIQQDTLPIRNPSSYKVI